MSKNNKKGLNMERVQEVLENAIERATAQKSVITASGRTDTGVHAMGQVVNFQTNTTIAPEKLAIVINLHLPSDVRVLKSFVVKLCNNLPLNFKFL